MNKTVTVYEHQICNSRNSHARQSGGDVDRTANRRSVERNSDRTADRVSSDPPSSRTRDANLSSDSRHRTGHRMKTAADKSQLHASRPPINWPTNGDSVGQTPSRNAEVGYVNECISSEDGRPPGHCALSHCDGVTPVNYHNAINKVDHNHINHHRGGHNQVTHNHMNHNAVNHPCSYLLPSASTCVSKYANYIENEPTIQSPECSYSSAHHYPASYNQFDHMQFTHQANHPSHRLNHTTHCPTNCPANCPTNCLTNYHLNCHSNYGQTHYYPQRYSNHLRHPNLNDTYPLVRFSVWELSTKSNCFQLSSSRLLEGQTRS